MWNFLSAKVNMDKVKFECALRNYAEELILAKGGKPLYGGFKTDVECGDIRVWRPTYTTIELQVGHFFFRYGFRQTEDYDYRCALVEVSIRDFDKCLETAELGRIGVIRHELKELEAKAEEC